MTNIAEVSVIVSGAVGTMVGLGGPGVTSWFANRRDRDARTDARLVDLRSVLDDAAFTLLGVMRAMPPPEDLPRAAHDPKFAGRLKEMRTELLKVWQQEARIAARVGTEDELYVTYHAAHDAVGNVYSFVRKLNDGTAGPSPTGEFMRLANQEMPAALGTFFDATARRIGPHRA